MPWQEATPMEQRKQFVSDYQRGLYTMTELCARYGVSRKTGYKWLDRFDEGGRAALGDRSRAPHTCPHAMSEETARLIVDARGAHPTWGPRKLLEWLAPRHPRCGVARVQHGRRPARARRLGDQAAPPSDRSASRCRRGDDHAAERRVDGRFQRALSDRRRDLLLSAHGRRSAHTMSARVSGSADDQR
jgi:hypothetical protein